MKEDKEGTNIAPAAGETPVQFADRLGEYYTGTVTSDHKKGLGQFFTPRQIAQFMATFGKQEKQTIRILDPGCGIGILSAALAEALITGNTVRTIELVAFETDVDILPLAEKCFHYLSSWLHKRNIAFTFFLCKNDFILHNSVILANKKDTNELYDIVISNPPYFKLPKDDERAVAARAVIYGQTNIYSIFLLIAAKLLKEDGLLIFITPRSFCSGNYFRLFRELFFSIIDLTHIHLFQSRKNAFKRDKVLQENIIVTGIKKSATVPRTTLTLSVSNGADDIAGRRIKEYAYTSLINFDSSQKILHLPSSETDEQVIAIFKTWTGSLASYGLDISTGPVVDFRSLKLIRKKPGKQTVPLIWLHNIDSMQFLWPRPNGYKGKEKNQYIINNKAAASRLIKNRNYVFLRRFSSKEDNRRLVAAPYFQTSQPEMPMLGVENHLNYIYRKNEALTTEETIGLAAMLNSRLFDLYFRTFNGNINVSATELRDFPLPDFALIHTLGQRIADYNARAMVYDIDSLVAEIFGLPFDLSTVYGPQT